MNLLVDTTRGALVASQSDTCRVLPSILTIGDSVPVVLSFLQRNPQPLNTGAPIYNYLDLSTAGVVLSIGSKSAKPSAGTFTLTFGANTTAALSYNASSYEVAAALNALASITTAGGVSVSGDVGGSYVVTFLANGAQAAISASVLALVPAASALISTAIAGTSSNPAVQSISIKDASLVQVTSWTAQSAPAVTVTQLSGNLIQRVSIPAGTYGGSFTLTYNGNTTAAIPFAAQLDLVEAALNALPGIVGATVWPGQNFWDITIPSGAFTLTGSASGLIVPLTLTGSLPLTAPSLASLLVNGTAVVPLYIQSTTPTVQTLFAGAVGLQLP